MAPGRIKRILRRHGPRARSRGTILRKFVHKIGLIYFGVVDQHKDDHEVIRGLTTSTTHRDEHYAVGSFDGYDISIVDRSDVIPSGYGKPEEYSWVIFQIDLISGTRLPRIFLKPHGHTGSAYMNFFQANARLKPVNGLLSGHHTSEFHSRYEIFTNSSHTLDIEKVLTPDATNTIAARLWPHAIEMYERKLYVYTTQTDLSEALLDTCLESALWLAQTLDQIKEN